MRAALLRAWRSYEHVSCPSPVKSSVCMAPNQRTEIADSGDLCCAALTDSPAAHTSYNNIASMVRVP